MSYNLIFSYIKVKRATKIDFLGKCRLFQALGAGKEAENLEEEKIKKRIHRLKKKDQYLKFDNLYHVVILATYKEDLTVLKRSIQALKESNFPSEKVFFVLAAEERGRSDIKEVSDALKSEYASSFKEFFVYLHPDGLPGEVIGKGGNITFAGRQVLREIKKRQIPLENVLVTTLDADNCVSREYLAYLSLEYLKAKKRTRKSYQPLPFFSNNFWKVSMINRVVSTSSSFWQMIESNRPSRLRNFSAHAQSLKTLVDTDFWSVESIVEDGHQYWRTYFTYNGDHQVIPLFVAIYQDAVEAETTWQMIVNQYKQLRRWAWGVSDIAFVAQKTWEKRRLLPWAKTLLNLFRLVEGHLMWATLAITVTINNNLLHLFNPDFRSTVMAYNASHLVGKFFTYSFIGLIVLIYMSLLISPARNTRKSNLWDKGKVILQWLLIPIVTVFFGALPAIDAQTRLMLGKRLEFWVTPKS
ncbi:MAG TPA: hypothetical protein ENI70_00190 [Candidatus Peregrinibacteria bacterium]|nr:hypothetical protein [Candidatus Peregrinibacteria bacterium]